jgi:diguanylate cyclase
LGSRIEPNVSNHPEVAGTSVNRRSTRAPVLHQDSRPSTTLLWATFSVVGVLLVAYLVSLLLRPTGSNWTWLDGWSVCAVELGASALCIGRGLVRRPGRVAAVVLGISLLMWTLGDIALTVESLGGATPPAPSVADAFYLAFYPFAYVAVVLFIRGEVRRFSTPNWLDGGIAGLGAAAVCAAFAFHSILHSTGGHIAATVTDLAYPVGDLLLLGLVVGGSALLLGRPKAPWALLASGLALNVVGDTSNLYQASWGRRSSGASPTPRRGPSPSSSWPWRCGCGRALPTCS